MILWQSSVCGVKCDMAENGSSQNEDTVTRKESHQDPLWIETQGGKVANKVRVDKLQGTIMDLMK